MTAALIQILFKMSEKNLIFFSGIFFFSIDLNLNYGFILFSFLRRAAKDCNLVEADLFKQVQVFLGAIC